MEPNIAISTINDFLFCPKSLYMHQAAGRINPTTYHSTPQTRGNALHASIDNQSYSDKKSILQGANIYCQELGIYGKLDTFNVDTGELVERKAEIKHIYEGYLMQLYSEYFCLREMGYEVKTIGFYSMVDNKKYSIEPPGEVEKQRLEEILDNMRNFDEQKLLDHRCPNCDNNIYSGLSW